jgi:hypothetical protein
VGWWRVLRRRIDVFALTAPLVVAVHVWWPYLAGTRYLLPLPPGLHAESAELFGFFSIRRPIKINGVVHHPSVCYEITIVLRETVEDLVAKGEAFVYPQRVVFVNGAPMVLGTNPSRPIGSMLTPETAEWVHPTPIEEGDTF